MFEGWAIISMFFQDTASWLAGQSDWFARFTNHRLAMMTIIGKLLSFLSPFELGREDRSRACIQLAL